mmetsp:Transcript_23225/g.55258  ORF Transcript_23225/g.55258 Transcript_23225/m.55258 type:complete len:100 (+) Transcript_23225:235-534(+)
MVGVCCKETPAAFSGQVSIGDVVEAVDGEVISSLDQLKALADGEANTLVMIELRRQGQSAAESLHLMRNATQEDQAQSPNGSLKVVLVALCTMDLSEDR